MDVPPSARVSLIGTASRFARGSNEIIGVGLVAMADPGKRSFAMQPQAPSDCCLQQAYPRRDGLGCDRKEKNDRHMPRKRITTTTQANQKNPKLPVPGPKTRDTTLKTEDREGDARLLEATP